MTIKWKLIFGSVITLSFFIVFGVTLLTKMADVQKQFSYVIEHDAPVLTNANRLFRLVVDMETGQRGFCITQNEAFLEPYNSANKEFYEIIEAEKALVRDNLFQVEVINKISDLVTVWLQKAAVPEIAKAREIAAIENTIEKHTAEMELAALLETGVGKKLLDDIREKFSEFIIIEEQLTKQRYAIASQTTLNTRKEVLYWVLFSILLGSVIAALTLYTILTSINKLIKSIEVISDGNLDHRVEINSKDEIGQLSVFFNRMLDKLWRSENTLHESRAQLLRAQYIAKMGGFSWELASGAVTWSEGMHRLLKYDLNDIIDYSKVNADIHHPDDLESVTAWLSDSIASGRKNLIPKEYRLVCKDGEVLEIRTEGQIEYKDGKAVRVFGICRDISEQKRSEERLRENEAKYRLLFESMVQGVVYQNAAGSIVSANSAAQSLLGLSLEQLCGRKSIDSRWKAIHEDGSDFPGETHPAMVALKTGEPVRDVVMGIYNPAKDSNNWLRVNAVPQFKPNEKTPCQVFTTFYDITESRQTEKALKNNQNFLNSVIDQSPFAIWISDEKGTIIKCNAALKRILNITDEQLVGKYNVFEDEVAIKQGEIPKIRSVFEEGKTINITAEWDGAKLGYKNAKKAYIEGTMFPIHDDKGNLTNVVNHWIDVTERKQAEEEKRKLEAQLQQVQKMESIGTLAGGIAHDFNNMLGVITGNISYAQSILKENDELSEVLSDILESSKQAQSLTQQLLTFSKGGEPIKKAADINKLIHESAVFSIRGGKTKCNFEFFDDLWASEVDEGQINQVIGNLVINANQAMPNEGSITIRTDNVEIDVENGLPLAPGRYIKIIIEDQGIGIPQKHLSNIFDPYFTTKQLGSGLGLATTYSIVKKHGGHIAVQSEVEKGTVFTVLLPASSKSVEKSEDKEESGHTGKGRILIMDDQDFILKTVERMVNHIGYEAVLATDGAQAVTLYSECYQAGNPFDLVILDLTVPGGMGGLKTIVELLKIDPDVKALVSSGYSNDPVMANYEDYGFCGTAPKPFSLAELSGVLNEVF